MNASGRGRLPELEGLRGVMSWWVVVCHLLQQAGFTESGLGRGWRILAHGEYPVDVFIILSGFVIHKLWHDAQEPYGVFITRRFLRLWPAYAICLLGALVLRPCLAGLLAHAPLAHAPGSAEHLAASRQNWQHEEEHFSAHLLAHLPMLHSAVPETILPVSSLAFLGPAWSISLEWQFYLIAPPLFWFLKKGGSFAWLAFAGVAGVGWMLRYVPPLSIWFPMEGFLPQKLLLFGLGMISHQVWFAFPDPTERAAPALLSLALLVLFLTLSIPLALWIAVLAGIFSSQGLLKRALDSAPLQFLGRVSYSTYLGHMLILWAVQPLIFRAMPAIDGPQMLVALCLLAVPLIVVFSVLLHRCIEAPAIRLGRRIFPH